MHHLHVPSDHGLFMVVFCCHPFVSLSNALGEQLETSDSRKYPSTIPTQWISMPAISDANLRLGMSAMFSSRSSKSRARGTVNRLQEFRLRSDLLSIYPRRRGMHTLSGVRCESRAFSVVDGLRSRFIAEFRANYLFLRLYGWFIGVRCPIW